MTVSPEGKGCVDRNECLDAPCLNGGTCINQEPRLRYRCICPENFWGENCMFMKERQALKLSTSAFAAVIGCLLIIISEFQCVNTIFYLFFLTHLIFSLSLLLDSFIIPLLLLQSKEIGKCQEARHKG